MPHRYERLKPGDGVAVIGLGKMGIPMARNLIARGFPVSGFDVSEDACALAREAGIRICDSPRDAAERTKAALVVVGFDDQVAEVVNGPDGLVAGAAEAYVIGVCSSVEPQTVVDVAARARLHGVDVIDSPVCRGEPAAAEAALLVLCGGEARAVDRLEPALLAIGSDLCRLGDLGSGQVGKMLNNYLLWSAVVANHETLRLGARLGVDPDALREALMLSSGNNWALETWKRPRPMPWAEEDMRVLLDHARSVDLALPAAELTAELIETIKQDKAAWADGGGRQASMDAFTRAHP